MVIQIKNKAFRKMKEYAKQMKDSEIGGLIIGEVNDGNIIVRDIRILKQEKDEGTFDIDDNDLMNLTKNADGEFLSSILGWWHSHAFFGTFWSDVDDECFKRLCNLSGKCLGIVVSTNKISKKLNLKCRLDFLLKKDFHNEYISIDNIIPEFDWLSSFKLDKRSIQRDIQKKVKNKPVKFENVMEVS